MDAIGRIVKDIIDLKMEAHNIQIDATMESLYDWYSWTLQHNIIEVTYKYGILQGFIEWVRLDHIPLTRDEVNDSVDFEKGGDILYITNCCVRDDNIRHGILWKLIHMVREKNKTFDIVCWHDLDGVLHIYENAKGDIKELEHATAYA